MNVHRSWNSLPSSLSAAYECSIRAGAHCFISLSRVPNPPRHCAYNTVYRTMGDAFTDGGSMREYWEAWFRYIAFNNSDIPLIRLTLTVPLQSIFILPIVTTVALGPLGFMRVPLSIPEPWAPVYLPYVPYYPVHPPWPSTPDTKTLAATGCKPAPHGFAQRSNEQIAFARGGCVAEPPVYIAPVYIARYAYLQAPCCIAN